MHACGHDGHTATMLLVADFLKNEKKAFLENPETCGKIRFLFQPAEEGGAGAKAMLDAGALENVDAVFGYHNSPLFDAGVVATRAGSFMASVDRFVIQVKSKGGHAAYPHLGGDVMLASSQIVQDFQVIAARFTDPTENCVVSVCRMEGGTTFNVLPDKCELEGTVRASSQTTRLAAEKKLHMICERIVEIHGNDMSVEINYERMYPPVVNHPREAEAVLGAARSIVEKNMKRLNKNVDTGDYVKNLTKMGSMGGEDFAFYLEKIPGCFFFVGNGKNNGSLHSSSYDYNDRILPTAARVMGEVAIKYLGKS